MNKYKLSTISYRSFLLSIILLCTTGISLYAQVGTTDSTELGSDKVDIIYSDSSRIIRSGDTTFQKLQGSVELKLDSIFFYCDSAIIVNEEKVWAYGNIVIQQTDTTSVFADSVFFDVNTSIANLMGDTVILVNGAQQLYTKELTYDLTNKVATYYNGANLFNEDTQLSSKRGYYYVNQQEAFFKDSVVVIDPEFELRADTLKFNTASRVVGFLGPTLITSDTSRIYCEDGFYDTANGVALFTNEAQFKRGDQVGKADSITYDASESIFTLLGNGIVEGPDQKAIGDTITYNQQLDVFNINGNAYIKDGERVVEADNVFYNAKDKTYNTIGRSFISDPPQLLQADKVDFSEGDAAGLAFGNVIWQDTSSDVTIKCEQAYYDRESDFLKASGGTFGRPLMILIVEEDSLFLVADTLVAARADVMKRLSEERDSVLKARAAIKADSLLVESLAAAGDLLQSDSSLINNTEVSKEMLQLDSLLKEGQTQDSLTIDSLMIEEEVRDPMKKDSMNIAKLSKESQALDRIPTDSLSREEESKEIMTMDSMAVGSILADTILQDTIINVDKVDIDTSRHLYAFFDVRIYKSNLQAVCDSLEYSSLDSIFYFFDDPVIWSDTTQMSADSIQILLKNDAIDRVFMREKGFIVNREKEGFFNQIKGKDVTAFFKEQEIASMLVEGNAESVYYAKDEDDSYIAVNKTVCSEMILYFKDKTIDRIRFLKEPEGEADPVEKGNPFDNLFQGYRWRYDERPKSKEDLFKKALGQN